MHGEHIHFVTGRLAEPSLRAMLPGLSEDAGFHYSISVLNITVAALMTTDWIAKRLEPPTVAERILLPGYCRGEVNGLSAQYGRPCELGPRDLRDLPAFFQQPAEDKFGEHDIEIIAEINHCPQHPLDEIVRYAEELRAAGADVIDIGCNPGEPWSGVTECVTALRDAGHRVSIDSFDPDEVSAAAKAGAELVLSVNASNREAASDWGCEVVAIPDDPRDLDSLEATIDFLASGNVPFRIDPILEPIGFGFAASLGRYMEARRRWPDVEIMMGIGNLTELTDVDSAGVNVTLLGICQELGIRSVLTTQVINWAQSAVAECELARQLVYHSVNHKVLPKHLAPGLIMLRDPRLLRATKQELNELAANIKDNNYRIFLTTEAIHLLAAGIHLSGRDPFEIMRQLLDLQPANLDASHAFYLGHEMCKAVTALTLNKNYEQDEALDWGILTQPEESHRLARHKPSGADRTGGADK